MEPVSIVVGTLCRPLRHKGDCLNDQGMDIITDLR